VKTLNYIKLTTFHQKLCYACLKSGGYYTPIPKTKGGGYAYPTYLPHDSTPAHTYPAFFVLSHLPHSRIALIIYYLLAAG